MNFNVFDFLNSDEWDGIVRHVMGVVGTGAVVTHNFDPTQWQSITGAVVVLVTMGWSVASKKYLKAGGTPVSAPVVAAPSA